MQITPNAATGPKRSRSDYASAAHGQVRRHAFAGNLPSAPRCDANGTESMDWECHPPSERTLVRHHFQSFDVEEDIALLFRRRFQRAERRRLQQRPG